MAKVGRLYKLNDTILRAESILFMRMEDRIAEVVNIADKKVFYRYLKQDAIYDLGLDMFEIFFTELTPTEVILYA